MTSRSTESSSSASRKPARPKDLRPAADREETEETPSFDVHPAFQAPRGMHDVLPADQPYWDIITDLVRQNTASFNFQKLSTPIAELPGVFERSLGGTSDVVAKELFFVRDRTGKEKLVLRPEGTAGVVRAYLEHQMYTWPQPVRLWYLAPHFRHERPQAGRYRQFWQFGAEVIGEAHPLVDAQLIHMAYEILRGLQLEHVRLEINSIGHLAQNCRLGYVSLLKTHAHAQQAKLCRDCKLRLKRNPLRLLDCKEEKCRVVANTAPKLSEHLCDVCAEHYRELKGLLTELGIPYRENPRLVRGLDYYTRTVFEVIPLPLRGPVADAAGERALLPDAAAEEPRSLQTILAGGRYDTLVEQFGGPPTPAVGFSAGIERVILAMKAEGIEATRSDTPEVFLVHLGDLGRTKALHLFDDLRRAGFRIAEAFHRPGIKAQLRVADRLRVPWALILGQKEALDGTIILRNMESGVQETLDLNLDALLPVLKKRMRHEVAE